MEQKDLERKKLAKEIEDYKTGQKAANLYWAFVILIPLMFIGFNSIAYIAIAILLVLSIHIKTRRIAYFLLTVPIPIYAFFIGGWVGFLAGFVPAILVGMFCAANYVHHKESKRLEGV